MCSEYLISTMHHHLAQQPSTWVSIHSSIDTNLFLFLNLRGPADREGLIPHASILPHFASEPLSAQCKTYVAVPELSLLYCPTSLLTALSSKITAVL